MAGILARFSVLASWLNRLALWLGVGLAGLTMLSNRLLPWAAAGLCFLALAGWAAPRRAPVGAGALAGAGLFGVFVMSLVSASLSARPEVTLPQVYRLWVGMGLYLAFLNWTPKDSAAGLRLLAWGAALAGAFLAGFALFSVEWAGGKLPFIPAGLYTQLSVSVSDSVHPNVLAGNLALLLVVTLGVLAGFFMRRPLVKPELRAGWGQVMGLGLLALGMLAMLALTQSRGALLALGAAGLLLGALLLWSWLPMRRGWRVGTLAAVGALLAAAVFLLAGPLRPLANSYLATGLDFRVEVWARAGMILRDFPFTGVGMGLFGETVTWFYPYTRADAAGMFIPHAHNLFLQIAVDLGLPGLAAWLLVFLAALWNALQTWRAGLAQRSALLAGLGAGLLAALLAAAVHGLTDAVVWGMVRPAPLLWGLMGLAGWGRKAAANLAIR